jgi:hypothetical protein
MAKERQTTERVAMYLNTEAVDLLTRLAPSPKKRGQYVSELIRRAAVEAGLVEPGAGAPNVDLSILRHQLAAFEARYLDLKRRVDAAIGAQEGSTV